MSQLSGSEFRTAPGKALDGLSAELFNHWRELSAFSPAADGIPIRQQIDMLTLPVRALPWFFLHERIEYRYRSLIAGTRLAETLGFEPKGRFLDDLMPPAVYAGRREIFDICLLHGRSFFYRGALSRPTDRHVAFCRLLLPLRRDPVGPIDMLCGLVVFLDKNSLDDRDRRWVDSGFDGLFDCLIFEGGEWRDWVPEQANQHYGQPVV